MGLFGKSRSSLQVPFNELPTTVEPDALAAPAASSSSGGGGAPGSYRLKPMRGGGGGDQLAPLRSAKARQSQQVATDGGDGGGAMAAAKADAERRGGKGPGAPIDPAHGPLREQQGVAPEDQADPFEWSSSNPDKTPGVTWMAYFLRIFLPGVFLAFSVLCVGAIVILATHPHDPRICKYSQGALGCHSKKFAAMCGNQPGCQNGGDCLQVTKFSVAGVKKVSFRCRCKPKWSGATCVDVAKAGCYPRRLPFTTAQCGGRFGDECMPTCTKDFKYSGSMACTSDIKAPGGPYSGMTATCRAQIQPSASYVTEYQNCESYLRNFLAKPNHQKLPLVNWATLCGQLNQSCVTDITKMLCTSTFNIGGVDNTLYTNFPVCVPAVCDERSVPTLAAAQMKILLPNTAATGPSAPLLTWKCYNPARFVGNGACRCTLTAADCGVNGVADATACKCRCKGFYAGARCDRRKCAVGAKCFYRGQEKAFKTAVNALCLVNTVTGNCIKPASGNALNVSFALYGDANSPAVLYNDRLAIAPGVHVIMEHVTLSGGDGENVNGGLAFVSGRLTGRHCQFTGGKPCGTLKSGLPRPLNQCNRNGGAVYVFQGAFDCLDCTFTGNQAHVGGAIFADSSAVNVTAGTFTANQAGPDFDGWGGAVALSGANNPTCSATTCPKFGIVSTILERCVFKNNKAGVGGAVFNAQGLLNMRHHTFSGNSIQYKFKIEWPNPAGTTPNLQWFNTASDCACFGATACFGCRCAGVINASVTYCPAPKSCGASCTIGR